MDRSDPILQLRARQLKALGHGGRLAILRAVVQGPVGGTPAGEIQAHLDIPASTLSHHLGDLAEAGLLRAAREGTTLRYSACFDQLRALTDFIWHDCCAGGCKDPDCL